MPQITNANVANAIVKLVAAEALPALMGNLIMGNLVNRDYEPTLASAGDTVNVPIPAVMAANNVAAGSSVTFQNPNIGNAQIVLNTHAESSFQIPDVTKILATPDLLNMYMQPALVAIAEKIESDLLGLYAQFTTTFPIGTGGSPITEATVDAAETAMFDAKVPNAMPKYLVVSSNTYAQLRQIPRFSEYNSALEAGVKALIEGQIGKLKDFYVFRSQFVSKTGSGPVITNNLAFTKDAMALVVRRLPQPLPGTGAIAEYAEMGNFGIRIVMSYEPNTLAQQITVDCLYGAGVLRNAYGVQVRT